MVSPTVSRDTHSFFYRLIGIFAAPDPQVILGTQPALTLTATAAELSCHLRKEFLIAAVLDSTMQSTALPQDNASEETIPPTMIGTLG